MIINNTGPLSPSAHGSVPCSGAPRSAAGTHQDEVLWSFLHFEPSHYRSVYLRSRLTLSLVSKTASSVCRPSNHPGDNEAISRRAERRAWPLTVTPDGNTPLPASFNSSDVRGRSSHQGWEWGRRSEPPTRQPFQEHLISMTSIRPSGNLPECLHVMQILF